MSTRGHIDDSHMMIVGKYFENVEDFMNVKMVNKKYRCITETYKYNPIPLNDERTRRMFSGIETQHLYSEEDNVWNDGEITRHVHWDPIYTENILRGVTRLTVNCTRMSSTQGVIGIDMGTKYQKSWVPLVIDVLQLALL